MKPEHAQLLTRLISEHPYLSREVNRYSIHGAIEKIYTLHGLEPDNIEKLLLEWPHVSKDEARIAFTQSPSHGEADRQTVTTLGRYLTKCFPNAKSNVIRDVAALYQVSGCSFTERSVTAYVYAVQNGPASCMKWGNSVSLDQHPYSVYDPKYGWHMAINRMGDEIWGRCLCLDDGSHKVFVRSYHQPSSGQGYSNSDTVLEAWLCDQGYEHVDSWPEGTKVALISHRNGNYLMPYLNGDVQCVSRANDCFVIESRGEWGATSTNGFAYENHYCDCCQEGTAEANDIGYHGSHGFVCDRCADRHYTYALGCHGESYYIRNEDAIEVSGEYYDSDYLDDNNIVLVTRGADEDNYFHLDETVLDIHGEVWCKTDAGIVLLQHGSHEGSFVPLEETWQCDGTGFHYFVEDESKVIDGKKYHFDFELSDEVSTQSAEMFNELK